MAVAERRKQNHLYDIEAGSDGPWQLIRFGKEMTVYRNLRIEEHVAQGLLRLLGHAGHSMSEAREPGGAKAPDDAPHTVTSDRPLEPPRTMVPTTNTALTKNVVPANNQHEPNEDAGEPDSELASRRLREFLEHAARSLPPQSPQDGNGKSAAGESGTSLDERSSRRRRDARTTIRDDGSQSDARRYERGPVPSVTICPSATVRPSATVWRRGLMPVSRAEKEYQQMIRWIESQRAK